MIAALLKFFPVVFRQLSVLLGIPYVLVQKAQRVILLSSATNISSTGAITGLTAITGVTTGVVEQVYMFAQAGLAAGLYYARFSSSTACQLYTDAAGTITPTGITAGAYTPTINAPVVLASITVPGGLMGINGSLRGEAQFSQNSSANSRTVSMSFGGVGMFNAGAGNIMAALCAFRVRNRGSASLQQMTPLNTYGAPGTVAGNVPVIGTVDTSASQTLTLKAQISNAADWIALESYCIEIYPRN